MQFKSNVKEIVVEGEGEAARAVGVRLADGRLYRGKVVVSNATRWDTFESMMGEDKLPESGARRRRMLLAYPAALRAARTLCCPPTPRRKCAWNCSIKWRRPCADTGRCRTFRRSCRWFAIPPSGFSCKKGTRSGHCGKPQPRGTARRSPGFSKKFSGDRNWI